MRDHNGVSKIMPVIERYAGTMMQTSLIGRTVITVCGEPLCGKYLSILSVYYLQINTHKVYLILPRLVTTIFQNEIKYKP